MKNHSPEIIAHRGASAYAPENTLAAFALAADMQADWFELDCMLTKDNAVVIIHDNTVDRTTNGTGSVCDLTLTDLKKLDAGSWKDPKFTGEPVPTLAEALQLAKEKSIGVYVEIKSVENENELISQISNKVHENTTCSAEMYKNLLPLIERDSKLNLACTRKVIQEIRNHKATRNVVVQSFSPIICLVVKKEAPQIRVELLGAPEQTHEWEQFLRWGFFIGVDGFNLKYTQLQLGWLTALHGAGKTVAVWTVNNEDDMARFARWGVDRIITDRPDVCRKIVAQYSKTKTK